MWTKIYGIVQVSQEWCYRVKNIKIKYTMINKIFKDTEKIKKSYI